MEAHDRVQHGAVAIVTSYRHVGGEAPRMDSMDVNKGVAAVLVAGIAFFVTGLLGDNLIQNAEPTKPAIDIPIAPPPGSGGQKQEAPPIAALLASANIDKGKQFAQQVCSACHSLDKGGQAIVGPNLYGIVGAPHDHAQGFSYSTALEKFKDKPWTYDALNEWLTDPQHYAPGTKMSYTGIKSDKQRADVIDYLHTLSDHPEPLPKPPPPGAAQAGGGAPQQSPEAALDAKLASAKVDKGKQMTEQVCAICHSLNEGGKPIIGPNLYGVVGGPHDHEQGFSYSDALEKFKGQPWSFAALDKWLTDPATYAPGTKMTYAGIKNPQQRADVIAYLDTLSHHPVPIPGMPAKGAEPAAKSAEAAKPAGAPAPVAAAQPQGGAGASSPTPTGSSGNESTGKNQPTKPTPGGTNAPAQGTPK